MDYGNGNFIHNYDDNSWRAMVTEDITARITKLGKFFGEFNIKDDFVWVAIRVKKDWSVPPIKKDGVISYLYNKEKNLHYYFAEIIAENAVSKVFDAADSVIELNKAVEEKALFFKEKVSELQRIVATEPISKLRTLEFTFNEIKNGKKRKKKKTATNEVAEIQEEKSNDNSEIINTEEVAISEQSFENNEIVAENEDDNLLSAALKMSAE
jgi:hypothetical protein